MSYAIDDLEWSILKLLALNARTALTEIARSLGSTETVIRHRLEKLEGAGVIVGYRVEINLASLGMMFFKAQITLHEYGTSAIESLRAFCIAHPYITYFIEQIGECQIELEIEALGYEQYTEVINELREQFPKIVRTIETVLVRAQRFKWVPTLG